MSFVNLYMDKKLLISSYDMATIGNMVEESRACVY
jgi:hypothetical protein